MLKIIEVRYLGRKRKYEVKPTCEKCNKEPEPNKETSTDNWKVIDTICKDCGGKVILVAYEYGVRIS